MMSTAAEKRDLVITHVFDAPLARVWQAWIDPADLKQWWGPDGFTAPIARIDFREGGSAFLCMSSPQFGDSYSTWDFTAIVPQARIEYIHNLVDQDGVKVDPVAMGMPSDFPQDMRHRVTFKALGDHQTEVTVTEYDWPVGQMMELSRMGMEQCLNKMAMLFK